MFAIPILICQCRAQLLSSDLLLFVDNESAVAAVIRGVTKAPDARILIEAIHILQLRMGLRIWVEWIDSKSNPADGFSREGLSCSVAKSSTMELQELPDAIPPAGRCPWAWADCLMK